MLSELHVAQSVIGASATAVQSTWHKMHIHCVEVEPLSHVQTDRAACNCVHRTKPGMCLGKGSLFILFSDFPRQVFLALFWVLLHNALFITNSGFPGTSLLNFCCWTGDDHVEARYPDWASLHAFALHQPPLLFGGQNFSDPGKITKIPLPKLRLWSTDLHRFQCRQKP